MQTKPETGSYSDAPRKPNRLLQFFEALSQRLNLLAEVAMVNIFSLILLVILYLFYWTFPQAKDLLLTINQESHLQIVLFFTSLATLSGISWYMPRYFYKENRKVCNEAKSWSELFSINMDKHRIDYDDESLEQRFKEDPDLRMKYFKERIPRILSAAMLFLVTLGILNVGNEMNMAESSKFPWNISAYTVMAVLGGAYLLNLLLGRWTTAFRFNRWIHKRLGKYVVYYFIVVGLILIGLMWTKRGGLDDLPNLLLAASLVSISFLVFAICRKNIPFLRVDSNIRYPFGILAGLLCLTFILINLFPQLSQEMNPLVCANLSFVFYLTLLYAIRFWGMRRGIWSVMFLLLGIMVVTAFTNSSRHHEISYLENTYNPDKRLTTETYFKAWLDQRQDVIRDYLATHPDDSFPILIVSAEGGGSRAAFWTSRVHGYLENQIPGYYQNHLFALTGASGGSTGNATFFAMKQGGVASENMKQVSQDMFLENYLSSSLTLLLGADLLKDVLGIPLNRNRAKQLEQEWRDKLGSMLEPGAVNAFNEPFMDFWYDSKTELKSNVQPILLLNTTQVQGAGHAIVSPVQLKETTYWGMDLLDTLYSIRPQKTIPLVTANLLNASFPYINPAGQIEGVGSFVDAGYFDNYGARVAAGMLKKLSEIRMSDSLVQKVRFVSVLIRNSTVGEDVSADRPKNKPSSQLLAPISTISNIRSAVNDHNFWDLQCSADAFYQIDLKWVPIVMNEGDEPVSPIIPLARYLSPMAIQAMETSLDSLTSDPDSDLSQLVQKLK